MYLGTCLLSLYKFSDDPKIQGKIIKTIYLNAAFTAKYQNIAEMNNDSIIAILSKIVHPEYEQDIVSLGIVENVAVENTKVSFRLLFKRSNDPFAASIKKACEEAILTIYPNALLNIMQLVKEAPKKEKKAATEPSGLKNVKHIIAVASGKGGVGKSTISVNLAITLAQKGYKVGLVDADIYGPSVPKMMGLENARPMMVEIDGEELIEPAVNYGVKTLSIGFFVNAEDPLIWRGPMSISALKQLTKQGAWQELDFLLIDLPPGTGDIHLSMVSEMKLSGAIIVSTPQDVALADAIKAINMFRQDKIDVPILGIVENMAWFTPEELPENKYYIFGKEGAKRLAEKMDIPLLGEVPIVQSIREGGDEGRPAVLASPLIASSFYEIAERLAEQLK